MINKNRTIFAIVLFTILPMTSHAEAMSSSNFQVQGGTFGNAGTIDSSSANFSQSSFVGEPILGNVPTSTNFQNETGFEYLIRSLSNPSSPSTPSTPSSPSGGGGTTQPTPTGTICNGADFNFDGTVDLIDFGTLVFFWHQSNPSNACVDINSDDIVDLIDFGILVFEWTPTPFIL